MELLALPLFLFLIRKAELLARKSRLWRDYAQKASAQVFRIADFRFRIFLVFFFNPHSAIGIPQFGDGPKGLGFLRDHPQDKRLCGPNP